MPSIAKIRLTYNGLSAVRIVARGGVQGPQGATGPTGAGVPTGGETAQVLAKASATDNDTEWVTALQNTIGSSSSSNSTTTYATAGDCSFPVVSGRSYYFRFLVAFSIATPSTTGLKLRMTGPSAFSCNYVIKIPLTLTTESIQHCDAFSEELVTASSPTSGVSLALVEGFTRVSANGTIALEFASEVAGQAVTLGRRYISYQDLG